MPVLPTYGLAPILCPRGHFRKICVLVVGADAELSGPWGSSCDLHKAPQVRSLRPRDVGQGEGAVDGND